MPKKTTFLQLIKYGIVGVSNTLISMIVIFLLLKIAGMKDGPANLIGYIAGLINSFIWNRKWTFRSRTSWRQTFVPFIIMFVICYALQYGLLMWLNEYSTSYDKYYNHLIGMAFFTIINFLANKFITFGKER
ncbi:sugar translocase [Porphyromonas gingivalis]|uniref:GtrA family protein n=1 Tax=Porphyromonas gingivalis TaxID=837 RepID=A0AAE9XIF6_PORGN|nr:GtrA family protein [Porphyromonas gingivalis]OWP28286.1 sugar translocase [Porphyromonas gingivalis]WCG02490.1 GtrA family protein [Porphyromonas gingivalis]SJL32141.1 sugar translocase [Porphyromonas gingivalis]SJL34007.1 sugar translocase [Porphyromonas gingivalis]